MQIENYFKNEYSIDTSLQKETICERLSESGD